jgi:isopenicillin-N epimerase
MHESQSATLFPAVKPDAWPLDPAVTFLNHGSFGACPRVVLERQRQWREEMEREPVEFLVRKLQPLLDHSRDALAELIGADPADVVFVHNATAGVNAVLRSLRLRPGDEILSTSHDYNACRNVVRYVAERGGAAARVINIPPPIRSPRQLIDATLEQVGPRTRLVMLDHVASPTAIIFPVEELVRELDRRGVDALIDGAHAPGMLPLDVRRIGAAYYTGNCHKWLCAPKGAGFLHVRRDRQQGIQPAVISHGWNRARPGYSPFQDGFDWPGTLDPTAWLCVGEAIRFVRSLMPGGLEELMRRNHDLAMLGRRMLVEQLGCEPLGSKEMLGSMAALVLPDRLAAPWLRRQPSGTLDNAPLHDTLFERFRIEVPAFCWPDATRLIVRISAQAYNHPQQYQRLADALREAKG